MAAWTSRAAPFMSRFKSNCRAVELEPSALDEVISFAPAIWPGGRSITFRTRPRGREFRGEPAEEKINHRRRVKRQHLTHDQAADDGDAQRLAQFRTDAVAQRQRQSAEQRGKRGHQNRPETQQAGL